MLIRCAGFGHSGKKIWTAFTTTVPQRCHFSSLIKPTVLFQDNHLLAVNKPAGWHSVPNPGPPSDKCLMTELKRMELGGGSHKDFLLSLHRVDQPCSGVLLFAKTSKAATRVTTIWKKKLVQKEYLCVVSKDRVESLLHASQKILDSSWYSLDGLVVPSETNDRSVKIRPLSLASQTESGRQVSLEWKLLDGGSLKNNIMQDYQLLIVRTRDGARHMVRALLAKIGRCPIEGDLRYNSMANPLPDQSVALHAYRLSLDPSIKLGTLATFQFQAPIPKTWGHYFAIPNNAKLLL